VADGAGAPLVLLVDDDAAIRRTVAAGLELEGFEIVGASSGRAALEAAERVRPVAILLDLAMPDLGPCAGCAAWRRASRATRTSAGACRRTTVPGSCGRSPRASTRCSSAWEARPRTASAPCTRRSASPPTPGHELRTPLTSVQATLDALRRHPGLPEDRRTALLGDAATEQRRMVDLLDGLQALARGDAPEAEHSNVDLAAARAVRSS
jgi:hypothetical protein